MKRPLKFLFTAAAVAASLATVASQGAYAHTKYVRSNLVSNDTMRHPAAHQDPTLINPWGVAFFPGGPFWINDNGSGISALYTGHGAGFNGTNPALAVTVPPPQGVDSPSTPTGIVANDSFDFLLNNQSPALFIFATEDGTISAWNLADGFPGPAELKVDNSKKRCAGGSVYKGLALGVNTGGVFIYATNFRCGTVDVFDGSFTQNLGLSGKFRDPQLPAGFAPFGIANIRGNLVVTYAMQDAAKHDDVAGPGNGFVDVFSSAGNLIERFASRGPLNSPWGIAQAPFNFGSLSNDLLIGNFGDGRINAFNVKDGVFVGKLLNTAGQPVVIDGLWALVFGGGIQSSPRSLYFTAGPDHESDGIFGTLTPQ